MVDNRIGLEVDNLYFCELTYSYDASFSLDEVETEIYNLETVAISFFYFIVYRLDSIVTGVEFFEMSKSIYGRGDI